MQTTSRKAVLELTTTMASREYHYCIYCMSDIANSKGVGDHVIPARFGRFQDAHLFQGICPTCNSTIGRCEEQLFRCAPESFSLRLTGPHLPAGKQSRGQSWRGSQGVPPPQFAMAHPDHFESATLSSADPTVLQHYDQAVLVDDEGESHTVKLFGAMTPEGLRRRFAKTCLSWRRLHLHVDENRYQHFLDLLSAAYPDVSVEYSTVTEKGRRRGFARVRFSIHEDYWRAIAKIGFHYYLCTTRRSVFGHEPQFAKLRTYILKGGDHTQFVVNGDDPYVTCSPLHPSVPYPFRSQWAHDLYADETDTVAVAKVTLFSGPSQQPPTYQVKLGRLPSRMRFEGAHCAHEYAYINVDERKQYDGIVRAQRSSPFR